MSEDQDDSQKTEDPTHKRLEDAMKKGQVVFSREVVTFFMFLALALILAWIVPNLLHDGKLLLLPFLERPESFPLDDGNTGTMLRETTWIYLRMMAAPMLAVVIAAIAGSMIQKPITLSAEPMKPQFSRISIMEGAKRMFSRKAIVEFIKGLLKIALLGWIIYGIIRDEAVYLDKLTDSPPMALLTAMASSSNRILMSVCVVMFFIAMADYMYQRFEYMKNLRMSKQDLKDEYKQQEGDPHVKQRLRQLRRERATKGLMQAVPKADVVITNPTHYAVALQYDSGKMSAPVVVAKGVDQVALRIREIAENNKITIMRNPTLARALYATVEVDQPIQTEHYKAVAEIIGYVYRIKGKQFGGGAKPAGKPAPKSASGPSGKTPPPAGGVGVKDNRKR